MDYRDYLLKLNSYRRRALDMVADVESRFESGLKPEDLYSKAQSAFSPDVWQAFCLNSFKLLGVERKSGGPYAVHPTRMALVSGDLGLPGHQVKQMQILSLFHDYLEESGGRNVAGVDSFRSEYDNAEGIKSAVFLSEPQISMSGFDAPHRTLEAVAYSCQLSLTSSRLGPSYIGVCLLDKLDNLHDLDYVMQNPRLSASRKRSHLIRKFGQTRFVLQEFENKYSSLSAYNLLDRGVHGRSRELGIDEREVLSEASRLRHLRGLYESRMIERIVEYHQSLKLEV